jgi:hypothetical protein
MSVKHTLFISANRLKTDSAIGGSVDDNLLMPYILMAQDMYILPILGTDLDAKLKTEIQAGTLTGDYKTLLEDYIQKPLVQYAFSEVAPFMRLRFVNNAIVVMGSTDQSSSASYEDIKPLIDRSINSAQFYTQRLVDYLTNNTEKFSEYSSNSGSDLSPTTNNYYSGMNLDVTTPRSNKLRGFLQGANITVYGC